MFRQSASQPTTSSSADLLSPNQQEQNDEDTTSRKKKHTVTWRTPNNNDEKGQESIITFTAMDGELLRTSALRRGVSPHNERANLINCRGLGTCGTCAVALEQTAADQGDHEGDWQLPPLNQIEKFRLSVPPGHGADNTGRLRLACQIPVHGDLTVTKYSGFWGQYDEIAEPSQPTRPFGQAEFLLDRTSPPSK